MSISTSRVSVSSAVSLASSARVSTDDSWPAVSPLSSSPPRRRASSAGSSSLLSSLSSGVRSGSSPRPRSFRTRRMTSANAAWSPTCAARSSRWAPALASIAVANQRDAALGQPRRLLPGQALADDEAERGRQRHLVGGAGADDRVGLDPRLGHAVEVERDAGHVGAADRLDPRLLDGVDDVARHPRLGQVGGMDAGVVVTLPQREAVGPAARLGDLLGGQRPARLRHLGLIAVARRLVGGVAQVEVRAMAQRAQRRGERDAEVLERVVGLRHRVRPGRRTRVRGSCRPADRRGPARGSGP